MKRFRRFWRRHLVCRRMYFSINLAVAREDPQVPLWLLDGVAGVLLVVWFLPWDFWTYFICGR